MSYFEAGVAVREITPTPGFPLWGYFAQERIAIGTLDPLYVKACAFRAQDQLVVVVVYDLGRVPLDTVLNHIRSHFAGDCPPSFFFTATHTHHGPCMEQADAPFMANLVAASIDCIQEAMERLQPAMIGYGQVNVDMAHNRRILTKEGQCRMLRRNTGRIPTTPVDQEATIITLHAHSGERLATLVHYACHPVVMGPSNLCYSGDYVGMLTCDIKAATGAECLFLQGACGNINPYFAKTAVNDNAVDTMRKVGASFAETVLAALSGITPSLPATPAVESVIKSVPVGVRWDLQHEASMAVLRATHGAMFEYYFSHVHEGLCVPLTVVLLNRELALVGMPGEIFVQYQQALKADALVSRTLLCGYTNEYYAYFPTVRDAAAGGYGGTVASFVGLGAADRLLTEAEITLGTLSGAINPACESETFLVYETPDMKDVE